MKVHLIRHAQAVEGSTGLPDEFRYLTCRGRKRFRQVAASLKKNGISPDIIITSPRIRAVQTAEILSGTIRFNGELKISPELSNSPDLVTLGNILRANSTAGELVIVGHEPSLGEIIRLLLKCPGHPHLPKGCAVSMKISLRKPDLGAELTGLIGGGGKALCKAGPAMEKLFGRENTGEEDVNA